MKAIGYKEIFPYLKGEMSLEEALHILKRDTRHFAKRQLTWFRNCLLYTSRAAGALLRYIDETQKRVLTHINHVSYYKNDEYMILDLSTRRNLELTETIRSGEKKGSLLWVLDKTVTAMGGRMLRRWLEAPLLEKKAIEARQDMVEELYRHPGALKDLKGVLGKVYDLERICGKISFGTCNPKDMLSLKQSVSALPLLQAFFAGIDAPVFRKRYGEADLLTDIYELIDASIDDNAPFALKDGKVIKRGYNEEIEDVYKRQPWRSW